MTRERSELARLVYEVGYQEYDNPQKGVWAVADAILAAGYVKADHTEYAADHKFSDLEFTDEEGELWADREDFENYFKDYGGVKLVQRHVTEWEPVR